jgi:hypothetical protein
MPQSPMDIFHRCLPLLLPTEYSVGILQRVLKYLPPMPQSLTGFSSVITVENIDGSITSVKFSRELFFWRASLSIRPTMVGFSLFLTESGTERGITDDQYFNGRILSVRSSVKMLPTDYMPYTDGINPSVKLFNGVVKIIIIK